MEFLVKGLKQSLTMDEDMDQILVQYHKAVDAGLEVLGASVAGPKDNEERYWIAGPTGPTGPTWPAGPA